MIAFVEWWHRMMWAHPTPFVVLYAAIAGMWLNKSWTIVHETVLGMMTWIESRPIKRWIYTRRERRWMARQPKPNGAPYRE